MYAGPHRDTRKRNYTYMNVGEKASHGRTCSLRWHRPSPFEDATGQRGEQTDGTSVIVLSPFRTGIALLTSLTLDIYRKVFPAQARSLSRAPFVSSCPAVIVKSNEQRLIAFKLEFHDNDDIVGGTSSNLSATLVYDRANHGNISIVRILA